MRFRFVEEHRASFPTNRLRNIVGVSTRGLRAFRSRPASRRQRSDLVTLAHIKEQSRLSLGSYDRPRMTEELKEIGLNVGHRHVGRLMAQNGISVVRTRKHKVTTDSDHKFNIAPNLLDRDFTVDMPNQKWADDISYVWTREGWLYLAVILDLHSRRVIGWAVSNRMKRDLAIRALKMAVAFRSPPKGCIHHTDRGSQYCSHDYQKFPRQHGFQVSMNGKGNCHDNAAVETFFKTITLGTLLRNALPCNAGPSRSGDGHGKRGDRLRWRSLNTSMASTIRDAATQHWAGKALSLSKGKWLKRALGAARKRDRSNSPNPMPRQTSR